MAKKKAAEAAERDPVLVTLFRNSKQSYEVNRDQFLKKLEAQFEQISQEREAALSQTKAPAQRPSAPSKQKGS